MDGFDDDFAPLQSSESVPIPALIPDSASVPVVDEDDAPLFLGDVDLEIEKQQNSDGNENNSNPTRCKFSFRIVTICLDLFKQNIFSHYSRCILVEIMRSYFMRSKLLFFMRSNVLQNWSWDRNCHIQSPLYFIFINECYWRLSLILNLYWTKIW